MAYRHDPDHPVNQESMRVVNTTGNRGGVWFVAGAIVVALVILAFVFGTDRSTGTVPAGADIDVQAVDPVTPGTAPVAEQPAVPQPTDDAADTGAQGIEAAPQDDLALPPATETETVPETTTAN